LDNVKGILLLEIVSRIGALYLSNAAAKGVLGVPLRCTRPTLPFNMFRMRRYRIFIVFAVITIGALYHFTNIANLNSASATSVEGLKNFGKNVEPSSPPPASGSKEEHTTDSKDVNAPIAVPGLADPRPSKSVTPIAQEPESLPTRTSLAKTTVKESVHNAEDTSLSNTPVKESAAEAETESTRNHRFLSVAKPTTAVGSESANKTTKLHSGPAEPIINPGGGEGRLEIIAETGIPKIHWSQQPEHFPVPTENIIQLPTGKPKSIPKVQFAFKTESVGDKAARQEKQDKIRKVFLFSWAGYKKKAWLQDELSPISGKYRNPFNGWGATLVDSLDTLWIMGLKDEFDEAVEAVRSIDFTTSARNDIPLFETVIRYLGGLVAAYDISDGVHRIILDKAVELADILMGAFDTPNRMPMTFYLWKP
jgi:mannosyl-oligosaccharide alpha-1,2-mannosidase